MQTPWTIHIRKDDMHFQHEAQSLSSAIVAAYVLLRDGIDVQRIKGPDGLAVTADTIRVLCDSSYAQPLDASPARRRRQAA